MTELHSITYWTLLVYLFSFAFLWMRMCVAVWKQLTYVCDERTYKCHLKIFLLRNFMKNLQFPRLDLLEVEKGLFPGNV